MVAAFFLSTHWPDRNTPADNFIKISLRRQLQRQGYGGRSGETLPSPVRKFKIHLAHRSLFSPLAAVFFLFTRRSDSGRDESYATAAITIYAGGPARRINFNNSTDPIQRDYRTIFHPNLRNETKLNSTKSKCCYVRVASESIDFHDSEQVKINQSNKNCANSMNGDKCEQCCGAATSLEAIDDVVVGRRSSLR